MSVWKRLLFQGVLVSIHILLYGAALSRKLSSKRGGSTMSFASLDDDSDDADGDGQQSNNCMPENGRCGSFDRLKRIR